MKLISELTESNIKYLVEESSDGKKNLHIEGIFLQAECVNKNKRKYSKSIMEREVNRYVKEYVNENRAFGELGHPEGPQINLDRVSHRIVSIKEDGNNYIGKALILDTPMGNIAKSLIEGGGKLGVSSRGLGSLKNVNGINEVQNDFYLATAADIVADPSASQAFVAGIMESKEWIMNNGVLHEKEIENIQDEINKSVASRTLDESKAIKMFERFLKGMSKN